MVRYVQLAHNRRVDGVTQAEVLLNLGREDQLDIDGLRRLAASITRFTDGDGGGQPLPGAPGEFEIVGSRPLGGVVAAGRALAPAGRRAARWRRVLGARRFTTDVERVLFALVANRALDPCSKLAAAEWASRDVAHPRAGGDGRGSGLPGDGPAGRGRRRGEGAGGGVLRLRRPAEPRGRPAVLRHHHRPTSSATSPRQRARSAFRVFGHSKDHRPDLPQIVIGLAVTREGIPVRVWCWPGNTNDMTVIARGQGRPEGLAAGPRRDGRRPRLLLR